MDLKAQFGDIVDKLRKQRPVIHHITNYVTAESCADMALAAGASPVMADDPEEVEEITAGADALLINLGTINFNKMIAMEKAVAVAKATCYFGSGRRNGFFHALEFCCQAA